MVTEIIRVMPDRLDEATTLITLLHIPTRLERLLGRSPQQITYKGQEDAWYILPKYQRAKPEVSRLLNKVISDVEFRHHQRTLEQQRLSKAFPLLKRA